MISSWSCACIELIFSHMTKHVFFRSLPKGEILASMIKHSQRGTQLCQRVQYNHWFQVEAAHVSSSFSDTWLKSYFEIIWQKENFWHRWYACSLKSLLRRLNFKFRALFLFFQFSIFKLRFPPANHSQPVEILTRGFSWVLKTIVQVAKSEKAGQPRFSIFSRIFRWNIVCLFIFHEFYYYFGFPNSDLVL